MGTGVGTVLEHALGFFGGSLRRVHRQQRRVADEVPGVLGDDLGEAVIGDARHLGRLVGGKQPLDRRQTMRQHLRIVLELIDDAQAQIEIGERRDSPHPFAEVLLPRRRLQQRLVVALGKEMIVGVDVAH